jgi:uncharacterized low-complexity protein
MSKNSKKPVAIAVGAALVGGLALAGAERVALRQRLHREGAAGQPHHGDHKSEGKCGEGRCGMEKMDTDGDGRLSRAEFDAAHEGKAEMKAEMFATIDADGDGFISAEEAKARRRGQVRRGQVWW